MKELSKTKKQYEEYGFCTIKSFLNLTKIEELKQKITEIISITKGKVDEGSYINYATKDKSLVNSIHRIEELNHEGINKFVEDNKFKELSEYILGEECKLLSLQAFLKPGGYGLKTPAHQDNAYWCHSGHGGITLWISIDHAGKENSMMKYAKIKNLKPIDHILSKNTPGSSLIIEEKNLKGLDWYQPELSPGDIAIHNGLVVHYSEANKSTLPRRGFLINYRPTSCVKDKDKFEKYIARLENIYGRN